jgi:alpha-amylase/alpha-mannosidase (GH57 family)
MAQVEDSLKLLVAMADAFEVRHPQIRQREPLYFHRTGGGGALQHHAFESQEWSHVDEETLERLASKGLIRLDYGRQHSEKSRRTASASQGKCGGCCQATMTRTLSRSI